MSNEFDLCDKLCGYVQGTYLFALELSSTTERKNPFYSFPTGNNWKLYWEEVYTKNFKDSWPWYIYLICLTMTKLNTYLFTKCE